MSAHGLTPEALKQQHRTEIVEIGTFRPHGVTELEALDYLDTQEGKKYLQPLRNAAPDAPKEIIAARAMEQLTPGRELSSEKHTTYLPSQMRISYTNLEIHKYNNKTSNHTNIT